MLHPKTLCFGGKIWSHSLARRSQKKIQGRNKGSLGTSITGLRQRLIQAQT